MALKLFVLGGVVLALAIGWYLRHSLKCAESNMDRLKEEATIAVLKEQERLAQKKVTNRGASHHPDRQ